MGSSGAMASPHEEEHVKPAAAEEPREEEEITKTDDNDTVMTAAAAAAAADEEEEEEEEEAREEPSAKKEEQRHEEEEATGVADTEPQHPHEQVTEEEEEDTAEEQAMAAEDTAEEEETAEEQVEEGEEEQEEEEETPSAADEEEGEEHAEESTPTSSSDPPARSSRSFNGTMPLHTTTDDSPAEDEQDTAAENDDDNDEDASSARANVAPRGGDGDGGGGGRSSSYAPPPPAPPSMQFPYASSNFVAPTPTPIRPLPGDPRLLSGPSASVGAQGSTTASELIKTDPANSFESQWNNAVTTPTPPQSTPTLPGGGPMTGGGGGPMDESKWATASPVAPPTATTATPPPPPTATSATPTGPSPPPPSTADPSQGSLPSSFPRRALVAQRSTTEENAFVFEPTALAQLAHVGKSLTSPAQAASLATDVLRAAVDEDQEPLPAAHGWRVPYQPHEFEVLLHKGSVGLCMNMSVRLGCVSVTSFRRPDGGILGPAEASGLIQIGDDLIGVDGFLIHTPEDFAQVVGRLKSTRPVLLRFRRSTSKAPPVTRADPHGYRRGLRTSMAGLDNAELYTAGMWHMGVRYLAPGQWAAELHVDGGGIRRIGILPSEREAALVYNRYIHQTYGNAATQFMNPAANGSGVDARAGGSLPVTVSNVRDMKPLQRPMRRPSLKAAFLNEQKEQLRAQIMVFKIISSGGNIPAELYARALKTTAPAHLQEGTEKKKRKTFAEQPAPKPTKKKAKRGRRRKTQYSDESDEESGSDSNFKAAPAREVVPTRRSGRNVGKAKKSYVEKETNSDLEFSDDEKPANPVEEPDAPKGPQIDKIVGVRFHKDTADDDDVKMEFLIKWKDVSYMHLNWMTTSDIEEFGHQAVMRMRRYMQKNSRDVEQAREQIVVGDERDYSAYFSDTFLEVDRILDVKEVEEPEETNPYNNHGAGEDGEPTMKRGKKYLVKWRDLSYVDCTWEWDHELTDDRKIAAFHRHNHPPIINGAHPAMFEDRRPDPSTWAKYQESPVYNNQNTLRSYQLEGLNWMVFCWYNRRNCILADEMGLGKTVQATSILEHLRQREHIRGPFLVIAPLATLGNWKREIETWTSMNCVVYHDSEGGADIRAFIREREFHFPNEMYRRRGIYKFNVLVTSYQTLMADAEFLDSIHWRYIVIDEAHKLKNREAKLLQCLRNFTWDSCLLMTGTPLQNGVYELWCLLNFIEPEKFPSQQEFYDEYGELNTAEQVARLHEQLRPYMLRRVKEDVEKSIPPKEETIVDVELTTLQKKYYRAIFERNRSFLNMGSAGTVANLVNVEMELRKCCNHPFLIRGVEDKECGRLDEQLRARILVQASGKTVLLDKLMAKFKAEKKKILIFSQFKIMLDIIEDLCQLRGYSIERMDGSVRGNTRQAAIDRFNNPDSDTFAFLLSTRAGGVGINLIAASVVILYDSDWNPQNDLQAVARCHRIGQTQSVNIYRLVTKKTYEAQMFDIASKKLGMHHAVFETGGVRNEFDGEDDGGNMMSLMSLDREKIEMMIRYGAYAIMEQDDEQDPENRAINEVDIDQLLSSSRTIRYDPTRGDGAGEEGEEGEGGGKQPTASQSSALSFSKATFTSETSDSTIDFNDDQFWEKVLGPKLVQVLMTKVQEGWLSTASKDDIKGFLTQLRDLAREVVKERQRGGTMADADQVMSILIELKVTGPVLKGIVNVREVAAEWLEVIERPKRRRNQDAESELMYSEFLDGKKETSSLPNKKKKSGSSSSRRSKKVDRRREPVSESEDDFDQDDDEDTPVKKPKRVRRPSSTPASAGSKSGIHIVLKGHDSVDTLSVDRIYSTVKKIQTVLQKGDADPASPKKSKRLPTPRKPTRRKLDEDGNDGEEDDKANESGNEEDAHGESDGEKDDDGDDGEAEVDEDEEDEDDEEEDVRKSKRRKPSTNKKPSRSRSNGNAHTSSPKSKPRSESIDPEVDEEMWCRVCFSDQGFMDDPIVQCERCNVAVHKYCYGIENVPDGDAPWLCDYCTESTSSASDAVCALCPLKRTTSAFKKTVEGDWVHVVCALWAPGVQFSDVERMQDVMNVPEAIKETRGEHCNICKAKDGCIKCFRGSCLVYFHPLCGRESKGDFDMFMNDAGQLRAYCPRHRSRSRRT